MAIARGAGTEIIRVLHLKNVVGAAEVNLIRGVRHHIYTVLSIIINCTALGTDRNYIQCRVYGYDSNAGTTGQYINIFKEDMSVQETFVWNDKFSMNGHEPVDFTGPMDDAAEADAIADQLVSGSNLQVLVIGGEHSSDRFDITCTYIDQNNA